eukprot:scaffold1110_cov182-Ochromonas_danica.AAC.8
MALIASSSAISPRVQKIKDISLQKEILKDITASEFALRVEVKHTQQNETAIDYEKLIAKMDYNIALLQRKAIKSEGADKLLERIVKIKEDLILAANNLPTKHLDTQDSREDEAQHKNEETQRSSLNIKPNLRILLREDGTVDWDGAIASGKEVAKFGSELWERLNGKEEGTPSLQDLLSPAQAKVPTSPEITRLTEVVSSIQGELAQVTRSIEDIRAKLRQARREGRVLSAEQMSRLRELDLQVKELEKKHKLFSVNLDLEKICAYLQQELETSVDPSDQRMLVAEVALIDKQLMTMMAGISVGFVYDINAISSAQEAASSLAPSAKDLSNDTLDNLISLIDDDELNLVSNEVTDLKGRLGLDTQLARAMDWGSLGKVTTETLSKINAGLAFFGEGFKIMVADLQYAWKLMLKASQGYILKPREVNSLRRSGRDLLMLIPFTIILIIPLTPVGHVLVFGFIQRFFPEFFPSCFSEKRLNLRKLFSEVERKKDEDILIGPDGIEWTERIAQIGKSDSLNLLAWLSNITKPKNNSDNNSGNSSP